MFKGLAALFRTGLILNPMVLLGIISGVCMIVRLPSESIFRLYGNWHFYLLLLVIAFIFNFVFMRRYKEGGDEPDIGCMLRNTLGSALMLLIANFTSMSFVMFVFM